MSTNKTSVSTATSSVSLVPGSHAEAAQERVNELRRMRELIPRFTIPASTKATARLNRAASLSQQFVELTSVAVTNQAALVRGGAVTPAEIRDLISYADAYGPVADELEALAQFLRHSVKAARNQAGSEALTTYALAQRLSKRPEHADLVPYVADMRRALRRGRRAAAKAAETTPAPLPDTTQPS